VALRLRQGREPLHHTHVTLGPHGIGDPRMGRPEEYRRYARECLEVASGLRVPRARAALHHMAQVWQRLAQDAEVRSSRPREDELSESA
jgi:hypothetical protein